MLVTFCREIELLDDVSNSQTETEFLNSDGKLVRAVGAEIVLLGDRDCSDSNMTSAFLEVYLLRSSKDKLNLDTSHQQLPRRINKKPSNKGKKRKLSTERSV